MEKTYYNQDRHEALMAFFESHPAFQDLVFEKRKTINSSKWEHMSKNEINAGASLLISYWNLSGGSIGELDLYELLQEYMWGDEARKEINQVVKKHKSSDTSTTMSKPKDH